MATISFVSGQGGTFNGTSANINTSGLAIGDICFVLIGKQSANVAVGLPSGWTALQDDGVKVLNVSAKLMQTAGDLTATNTFTFPNGRGAIQAIAFRGGSASSISTFIGTGMSNGRHSAVVDWPAITGVPTGSIFLGFGYVFDDSGNFFGVTSNVPSGYTDSGTGPLSYGLGTPNSTVLFYKLNVNGTVDPPNTAPGGGFNNDFGYTAASFSMKPNTAPVVTVTAPTGTAIPPQPTVTWSYSDADGDAQTSYRVKIFTAAQFGIGGFDPEVSPNTWDSGVISGAATSQLVGTPLAQGSYRAYVKASDLTEFSAWSFLAFTEPFNGSSTMSGVGDMSPAGLTTTVANALLDAAGDLGAQPTVAAAAGVRPTIGSKSPILDDRSGRLGCGTAGAFVSGQGGFPTVCVLDGITEIEWDRRLDDVSEALVHINLSGDANVSCCECLSELEPWCHELHITRNGVEQWCGPITQITYSFNEVIIKAIDMVGWLGVKVPANNSNFSVLTNLTDIAFGSSNSILNIALNETQSYVLTNVQTYPNAVTGLAANLAFSATSLEHLNDLAHVGLNYTTLGRAIILSGQITQLNPLIILRDEHILGDVEFVKDGLLAGTRYYVHYQGDLGVPAISPSGAMTPANSYCYGAIERMRTENNTTSVSQAQALAAAYVSATKIAPRTLRVPTGSRLHPDTPWTVSDMICGARVDVQIANLCFPIQQSFILTQMKLVENAEGEQVLITLNPISTIGLGT